SISPISSRYFVGHPTTFIGSMATSMAISFGAAEAMARNSAISALNTQPAIFIIVSLRPVSHLAQATFGRLPLRHCRFRPNLFAYTEGPCSLRGCAMLPWVKLDETIMPGGGPL